MTISSEEIFLLNRYMGPVAAKVQLGTLIQNAESVSAGEVALASGKILIGSVSNVAAAQSVSGDITISGAGVTAIGAGKVLLAMLGSGIAPSHVVKFAGSFTTASGSATQSISVPGVLVGDLAFVVLKQKGASPQTILTAIAASNAITVLMSADPSTDHILTYQVLRAAS